MQAQGTHTQVLVVEDEDNIALALDWLLTREGYAHARVASGAEAMGAIRDRHPSLVLLDVMLPGRSGYDICRDVRADPDLAATRILMMTARGSAHERRRGQDLGADGFVAKPFDLAELRGEIRRLLPGAPAQANGSAG